MEATWLLLTGIGLAAAAGLNAYIPLLLAGLLARFDVISLAEPYDLLESTTALAIVAVLLVIELLADKIPAVDSVNDAVQTLVRPASGALLFAGVFAGDAEWVQVLALVGGLVTAGTVHGAKATARPVVNVTTAGVGGPVSSVVEDAISVSLTLAAIFAPVLVLVLLALLGWLFFRIRRRWRGRRGPNRDPAVVS
ncbi:MAG: DUF4126 domain-containing protein [Actinobacteria bacterium]|nr:DUF4126 domain-containing protein [Actinomycetota bacterium]MCB9412615.1 DUF4126 domain-containing protein [Actinomycetota bacterium]